MTDAADIVRAERGPLAQLRRDHLRPVHSVLNVAQLALADVLLVAWFWLAYEYLPFVVYVVLSIPVCVIHQRVMSEWIHEAAHYCLMRSRRANDIVGNLLSGIWFMLAGVAQAAGAVAKTHRGCWYVGCGRLRT